MKTTAHFSLLASVMALSVPGFAQETANTTLAPKQREQIQAIGQSVIQAMRTAEPASERDDVVAQISAMKQQVEGMATLDTSSSLSLAGASESQAKVSAQSQAKVDTAMTALRASLATLNNQTHTLRDQQQASSPTLWQRASQFLGLSEENTSASHPVVKPLSAAAVTALDNLDNEAQAAMTLPAKERVATLQMLSHRLTLSKQPIAVTDDAPLSSAITLDGALYEAPDKATPTFQTRTQHRRTFTLNNE